MGDGQGKPGKVRQARRGLTRVAWGEVRAGEARLRLGQGGGGQGGVIPGWTG